MPEIVRTLDENEFAIMGFTDPHQAYFQVCEIVAKKVPSQHRNHVTNVTQRLYDTAWILRKVISDMKLGRGIGEYEGLLSLTFYLLLTCADALGHIYEPNSGVRIRFRSFFDNLATDEQNNLLTTLHVWKTNLVELAQHGLANATGTEVTYPSHQQIINGIAARSQAQKLDDTITYLYQRRNSFTHEAEFPQLGEHPNLSVMLATKHQLPNVATLGDYDHLQVLGDGRDIYFTFFVDDPIQMMRWLILKSLGEILRDYDASSI